MKSVSYVDALADIAKLPNALPPINIYTETNAKILAGFDSKSPYGLSVHINLRKCPGAKYDARGPITLQA